MRRLVLVAAAVALAAFVLSATAVQAAPGAGKGQGQGPAAMGKGAGGGLFAKLNLTQDQKDQIKTILAKARADAKAATDKAAKMAIWKAAFEKIKALLTPEQLAQLEKMKGGGKGGMGGGQWGGGKGSGGGQWGGSGHAASGTKA